MGTDLNQQPPVISEYVIVAVHGVGTPPEGSISDAVENNLARGDITAKVIEFNWNKIAKQALHGRNLRWGAIEDVAVCLANASLSLEADTPHRSSRTFRQIVSIREVLFQISEAAIALWFTTLFFVAPLLATVPYFDYFFNHADAPKYAMFGHTVKVALNGTAIALIWALAGFLFSAILLSISTHDPNNLWVAVRRAIVVMLRPLLLVSLLPFLIPWDGILRFTWGTLRKLVLAALAFIFLVNTVLYAREYLHGDLEPLGAVWGWKLLWNVALVAMGMSVLAIILNKLIGPTLKVILDIFRYAVDGNYHHKLLQELGYIIDQIKPSVDCRRRIVVIAHSLGTVIAIDSLVNSSCWRSTDSVTLLTLGSPLKRFFFRFCPNLFFPANSLHSAQIIAARVARFRWMNCYRPWDQIGTRLALPNVPGLSEASTKQFTKIMSAHLDYWSDPVVRNILWRWSGANEWFVALQRFDVRRVGWKQRVRSREVFANILLALKMVCLFVIPLLAVISNFRAWNTVHSAALKRVQTIEQLGAPAIAKVTYTRQVMPAYQSSIVYLSFKFAFVDKDGHAQVVKEEFSGAMGDFNDSSQTLDVNRLALFIDRNSTAEAMVNINYVPGSPDLLAVRDFHWHPDLFDMWERLEGALFVGGITLLACVVFAFTSIPWLRLLIGEVAFEVSDGQPAGIAQTKAVS